MRLRQKVIMLAIAPLIVALCAIALFVRQQAVTLAQQQRATISSAYLASKEAELRHYVALATRSIRTCAERAQRPGHAGRGQAHPVLAELRRRRLFFRLRHAGQEPHASAPAGTGRHRHVELARLHRHAHHPAPDRAGPRRRRLPALHLGQAVHNGGAQARLRGAGRALGLDDGHRHLPRRRRRRAANWSTPSSRATSSGRCCGSPCWRCWPQSAWPAAAWR